MNSLVQKFFESLDNDFERIEFSKLGSYLESLTTNSKDNPYNIYVTDILASDLGPSHQKGSLGDIIKSSDKYVSLKLEIIDNDDFTNADGLFKGCDKLVAVESSPFEYVESANSMFEGCTSLEHIDTTAFSALTTSARYMFADCVSLSKIDTRPLAALIGADITGIFDHCSMTAYYDYDYDDDDTDDWEDSMDDDLDIHGDYIDEFSGNCHNFYQYYQQFFDGMESTNQVKWVKSYSQAL